MPGLFFRRLLTLAHDSRLSLAATILTGFLTGLLTIGQAAALSHVVDGVFLGGQSLADVTGLLRLLLLIVFLRALLAWGSEVSANAVAVRVKGELRRRLFDKILRLRVAPSTLATNGGPGSTRGERTGELVNAAVEGVEALDAYFSQYLPQLVLAALVPLSVLLVVLPHDLLSALILLLTAPLIPVFLYLIGKGAELVTKRQYDMLGRLSAHFFDSLQGLTTLKELGRSKDHARSIAETSDQYRIATMKVLRVTFLSALVLELVATVSTALVAVEVGLRLLYGHMAFQPALFLLLLAPEFYIPLRMLGLRFHAGMSGTTAARRIFEILDIREERIENSQGPVERQPFSILESSNLSFVYPGESQPALQNITLEIRAGEHVALVGPTGAGKSTLAALVLRFIEPTAGSITINHESLTTYSLESWRNMIAWVPQNPYLFHDTLAANLRLAKTDASQAELDAAMQAAHLDEFVRSLPKGYATGIGEQGARLSGGQAQRLALARAFLKDAPILILDEPTSSLDPENEALLEESTRRLMQGRTVITIAHRLNTVFHADRIFVLDRGRLVEAGSHAELIARGGMYARMVGPSIQSEILNTKGTKGHQEEKYAGSFPLPDFDQEAPSLVPRPAPLVRLLSFLRGSWGWVALSVLLGVLTVGSNVGLMGTSAYLISAAALHPELGTLQVAIVGVRFFGIARGVFRYAERLASHDVTFRLLTRLRAWFYRALEPLAPARLMQYRSGDLLARILADVSTLENFYVRAVAPPAVALLAAVGMTIFFLQYNAGLAWVYLAFMLLLGLGVPLLSWSLSRRPGAELVSRRAALQARLVDGIQGLPDLLAFGRGKDYSARLTAEGRAYGETQRRLAWLTGLSNALTVLLVNLGMLAVLMLGIPLVRAGTLPGVLLAMLTLAALAGFEAVMPLPLSAQMLSSSAQAAGRLFEIVDTKPAVEDNRGWRIENGEQRAENREQRIENRVWRVENRRLISPSLFPNLPTPDHSTSTLFSSALFFNYPDSNLAALQDISFQLGPGKRLAVVGPSGAGKSTLANLLMRFWDYSQGRILLDGRDLHEYAQDDVRRLFSVISPRTYFFNDTIRQNLLLARPSASEAEVQASAQRAQIHDFIIGLPQGYETMIGERGLRLSGGERQRLAIARALLKDAPIFLLDEPTVHLDPLTERAVLENIFVATNGHSLLLITHRLAELERMDEILVLDHGRIVERGSHAELLARGGLYRRLWDLQNRMLEDNRI